MINSRYFQFIPDKDIPKLLSEYQFVYYWQKKDPKYKLFIPNQKNWKDIYIAFGKIPIKFIIEFYDQLNWDQISSFLSPKLIHRFVDKINFNNFVMWNSEEKAIRIIEQHPEKIRWDTVWDHITSREFYRKYFHKINWKTWNGFFPEELLEEFADQIDWFKLCKYCYYDERVLDKFSNKIAWSTYSFRKEYIQGPVAFSQKFLKKYENKMNRLHVQDFLMTRSFGELAKDHGVYVTFKDNYKASLDYDQIEAPTFDATASQCRGLVLNFKTPLTPEQLANIDDVIPGDSDVMACGMFRFYNQGQGPSVDWSTAVVEEKLDGTCIIIYFDSVSGRWCSATRKRSEADVPLDPHCPDTFTDLVNKTIQQSHGVDLHDHMENLASSNPTIKDYTFVCELTSPVNRIVCQYDSFNLTLLAVRHIPTMKEEETSKWSNILNISAIKTYSISDLDSVIKMVETWNPMHQEGVVVKDANFQRIKIKNPAYVAYNRMKDSLSSVRGCVEVILLEKDDDVIPFMDSYIVNRINTLKPNIVQVLKQTEADYKEIKDIPDIKEYALQAQTKLWPACLFALRRNKTPDILTFAKGNHPGKAPTNSQIDNMLELCKKINPELKIM